VPNTLGELGKPDPVPETNIIKLPNISASVAQLKACVKELQEKGYAIPDYPEMAKTDEEKALKARFGKCSVPRSTRCCAKATPTAARRAPSRITPRSPHSMGEWKQWSQTHVSHMHHGDFYHGEKSMTLDKARDVKMELIAKGGKTTVLKPKLVAARRRDHRLDVHEQEGAVRVLRAELEDCRESGILFSLHVKATMMKVSHPIVFGHCVKIYYKDAFEKHGKTFDELGINVNNGMVDLYDKIKTLPESKRDEIIRDLHACQEHRPRTGHGRFGQGHHQLPFAERHHRRRLDAGDDPQGGKMWGADGKQYDSKCVMPESTFARIYQEMINFCKWHGNFDPKTMGTVPNVGLMAQQAEEYGSHDKTFEIAEDGIANIVDLATGEVLLTQNVEAGDIWRMCQVKDAPIRDWVKLAVTRARNSGMPAIFWLDPYRPHENELIKKVKTYLKDHDTSGLDIQIMSQVRAMRFTLERVAAASTPSR
jgi:isocitrate dehydrogenase